VGGKESCSVLQRLHKAQSFLIHGNDPYFKGCTKRRVSSSTEMIQVVDHGKSNRRIATTSETVLHPNECITLFQNKLVFFFDGNEIVDSSQTFIAYRPEPMFA